MSNKTFKKAVAPEELIEVRRQQLEGLQYQCAAVEKMLAVSADQQRRVEAEAQDTLRRCALVDQQIEEVENTLAANVKVMQHMASMAEEQLRQRYETLQKTVAEAVKENDALRTKLEEMGESKRAELRQWQDAVDAEQLKMDEKALQYGMELKNAMSHLHAAE